MSVIGQLAGQIDKQELRRLYQSREPSPVDVLNLLRFKSRTSYNLYGMLMLPTLRLIGASIRWAGTHVRSISGEPQSEELIVVRYPMIRRFIQMAMNPLYLAIANPLRTRGVSYFEASFSTPDEPAPFDDEPWIAVVHHDGDGATVRAIGAFAGGKYVYSSEEFSPVSFLRNHGPTDPNPLTFKRVVFFGFPSEEAAIRAFGPAVVAEIAAAAPQASIQLYRRSRATDFVPGRRPS